MKTTTPPRVSWKLLKDFQGKNLKSAFDAIVETVTINAPIEYVYVWKKGNNFQYCIDGQWALRDMPSSVSCDEAMEVFFPSTVLDSVKEEDAEAEQERLAAERTILTSLMSPQKKDAAFIDDVICLFHQPSQQKAVTEFLQEKLVIALDNWCGDKFTPDEPYQIRVLRLYVIHRAYQQLVASQAKSFVITPQDVLWGLTSILSQLKGEALLNWLFPGELFQESRDKLFENQRFHLAMRAALTQPSLLVDKVIIKSLHFVIDSLISQEEKSREVVEAFVELCGSDEKAFKTLPARAEQALKALCSKDSLLVPRIAEHTRVLRLYFIYLAYKKLPKAGAPIDLQQVLDQLTATLSTINTDDFLDWFLAGMGLPLQGDGGLLKNQRASEAIQAALYGATEDSALISRSVMERVSALLDNQEPEVLSLPSIKLPGPDSSVGPMPSLSESFRLLMASSATPGHSLPIVGVFIGAVAASPSLSGSSSLASAAPSPSPAPRTSAEASLSTSPLLGAGTALLWPRSLGDFVPAPGLAVQRDKQQTSLRRPAWIPS